MEKNNQATPYSIALLDAGGKKIMKLQYNEMDMFCPFKSRLVQQDKFGRNSFIQQQCDNMCPHFQFNEDNTVSLSCGSGKIISVLEPKQQTKFVVPQ